MRLLLQVLQVLALLAVFTAASTRDNHAAAARAATAAAAAHVDYDENDGEERVKIAKCCEESELFVDGFCTPIGDTNQSQPWRPEFESENAYYPGYRGSGASSSSGSGSGRSKVQEPRYELKFGQPPCRSNQMSWDVYDNGGSDSLVMLTSGMLRHYVSDQPDEVEKAKELYGLDYMDSEDDVQAKAIHYDYPYGHYCADKAIVDNKVATYAKICVPQPIKWASADNLIRKAVDPAFHAVAIVSYLTVAIVYFVLPQLRDLVGNIITSMTLCLIVNQCASLITIFTEFGNHINFLVADSVMFVSQVAAFFWLNALGYYVWHTFRSRNVFLRSTDGRKYCCYSTCVWCATIAIAVTAMFAHFTLETNIPKVGGVAFTAQETIGWLGLSMLFTSVGFTIIIDLCYVLTTINKIKRMRTYGRIHHKMKYSFRMFILIFGIMSLGWISTLFSMLKYDGLVYCHIIVNVIQALSILYVCVFGQKRVTFLLGKTCNCCTSSDNPEGLDWGEEMTAINAGY